MKNAKRASVVLAVWMMFSNAHYVVAQDWPQWRGPQRDGKVTGFTAPAEWPKELTRKWQTTVGLGDATPALVGDRLYVFVRQGDEEVTLCLNAASGLEIWRDGYAAASVTGPASRHPGPRSSPTVALGKVVTLGAAGVLSCLDAQSGKVAWRIDQYKDVPQFFTSMSPIIVDGLCIAHLGTSDKGAIVAFDLASSEPKWKWTGDGPAYASPVLMAAAGVKQIVVQTEKNVLGLAAADGKLLWQVPSPPQRRYYNSATPIVNGQTVIFTGQGLGTKAVEVEKTDDGFAARQLWTNDQLGTGFNTPVLANGMLFGISDRGNLFCLNAKDGQAAWTDSGQLDRFGAIVNAGSFLLALPGNAELIVLAADGNQYRQLARYKVSDTPTYAHPIVSGNRVFIKDQQTVTLYAIEAAVAMASGG
ncbi:MAG: PQQ-like beta-propeller repeat protein [Sedimentisphaerales bacterium]|nr:PQQ-like beta-propeller repeat protein [Sedimentisphaerales bacterium]